MDVNVLKQVKKRGPKKLRGIAAIAAKKREAVRKKKARLPQFDAQHPYRIFSLYRIEDMADKIDEYILKLDIASSAADLPQRKELIQVFHMIKNQMPWSLVKPFFREFDDSGRLGLVSFFKEFYARPAVQEKVAQMRELINSRKFTSVIGEYKAIPQVEGPEKRAKLIPPQPEPGAFKINPLFVGRGKRVAEDSTQRVVPMFEPGRGAPTGRPEELILSKREREYRRAPWMYQFTDEPIRGFVVRNDPRVRKYITSKYTNGWFNVSHAWYRDGSDAGKKRPFYPNIVGYRTVAGPVIVETREMLIASQNEWEKLVKVEFEIANSISYAIAHEMLEENDLLPKTSVEGVLASIDHIAVTNQDIARELSKVLVFLQRLIKDPQIHHFRMRSSFYRPEDIIYLDRYMTLPEIYKNPQIPKKDVNEIERLIKIKRRLIENDFYNRISTPYDPFTRRQGVKKQHIFKYLDTNASENCPSGAEDVIYYNEDGKLYCFNRLEIRDHIINPFTGNPFTSDFLKELAMLPKTASREEREQEPPGGPSSPSRGELLEKVEAPRRKQRGVVGMELAPGLFQKLREFISTTQCAQCSKKIYNPSYKSIHENETVYFCGIQCFDNYNF